MFLLRLSPLVPFNILNYALALSVRYSDFAIALLGMIPAIIMYAYYGESWAMSRRLRPASPAARTEATRCWWWV